MFLFVSKECEFSKELIENHSDKFTNMTVINVDPVLKGLATDDRIEDWKITSVPTLVTASPAGNGIIKKVGINQIIGGDEPNTNNSMSQKQQRQIIPI